MNKFLIIFFTLFITLQLCRIGTKHESKHEQTTHTCTDSTHTSCDGACVCDGFECE